MMMAGDEKRGVGSDGPTTLARGPEYALLHFASWGKPGQTNSRKNEIMERPSSWGLNLYGLL